MAKVAIVTDSVNSLPPDVIKQYGIKVGPLHLIFEGKDYRDGIDITPSEFWRVFPGLKELPTTSGVNVGDFKDIFAGLARTTDGILCIPVSKILSVTYSSAEQARDLVREKNPNLNIQITDSKNGIGAMGLIALEAARAAEAGKNLTEVTEVAEKMVPKVKFMAVLDTMKYLIKIGRAPSSAEADESRGVKAIFGIVNNNGKIDMLGGAMGKDESLRKMVDMVANYADTSKPLHVTLHYATRREDAEQLKEMVTKKYQCSEVYVSDFSPVIGAAFGPGVALGFYS